MPPKKSGPSPLSQSKCFEKAREVVPAGPTSHTADDRKKARNKRHKNLQKARKKEVQEAFRCLVEFIATVLPRNPHDGTTGGDLDDLCRMQFGDRFKGVFAADTHPSQNLEFLHARSTSDTLALRVLRYGANYQVLPLRTLLPTGVLSLTGLHFMPSATCDKYSSSTFTLH